MEDGAFALFLRPQPGGFDSSTVPALGNLLSKAKNANAWGSTPRGSGGGGGVWAQLELTDALYWGIIPRGLVAREQPPLPSNKTGEMFFRGGRRLYTVWLF